MTGRQIPYSRQRIDDDDIAEVVRVLRSDWLTQGPDIAVFERRVADYCGAAHAVAVSSATAGLHLACQALDIGPDDRVWTSPMSFVASANCARYLGAEVDFVDTDPHTGNLSAAALEEKLAHAQAQGTLPKVVIPVHYTGRVCDMDAIHILKQRYGFAVIEDAAHALGAAGSDGALVGASRRSELTVFSFHPVKPITTGEGGMVLTQDMALGERVRLLRSHGVTRDASLWKNKAMPAWYFEQQMLGYNYRMTDLQAALGASQMGKLDRFIATRRALAERYRKALAGLPLVLPPPDAGSGWHLYVVRLAPEASLSRDALFTELRARGIGANVHYMPIHLQPYYEELGFREGQFPAAETFFRGCLSLPLHQGLTEEEQDYIAAVLRELLA